MNDDTEIKKGNPITNEELEKIVATEDMILTANYSQTLFNVYYDNYKDIIITDNSKETVDKTTSLIGPSLDRDRWDKPIVYVSDKDVTLTDGKIIKAGKAISEEELKLISVKEDLTLTPRYKSEMKLFSLDNVNIDLILTIIFIIIIIPIGLYVIKSIKKRN